MSIAHLSDITNNDVAKTRESKIMNIAYCTNVRLPSGRAHGHQIAQVCDALACLGHRVTIFAPQRVNSIQESYHQYYSADENVQIQYLKGFDHVQSPVPLGPFGLWTDNVLLRRHLKYIFHVEAYDLLYTRAHALLSPLLSSGISVVLELHTLPRRHKKTFVQQCNACKLVVCLTTPMKDELVQWGVDEQKIIVEGDAVDPSIFTDEVRPDVWKRSCAIPDDVPVIGYAGQLESMGLSKGVEVLLGALEKEEQCYALIAGGPDSVAETMMKSLPNSLKERVHFLGILPHQDIPSMLRACDVLVYPAPKSSHPFYNRDTSPLKLFEYMAAEKPIVCADLLPVRDVVNEDMVTFFEPGNAQELADAIQNVLDNPEEAQQKVEKANVQVQHYTWDKRMDRILKAAV